MTDRDDHPSPPLEYGQGSDQPRLPLLTVSRWVGLTSLGFSLLFFIDPYLPNRNPLIYLPVAGAIGGVILALVGRAGIRERFVAMLPSLGTAVVVLMSVWIRQHFPHR